MLNLERFNEKEGVAKKKEKERGTQKR